MPHMFKISALEKCSEVEHKKLRKIFTFTYGTTKFEDHRRFLIFYNFFLNISLNIEANRFQFNRESIKVHFLLLYKIALTRKTT